MTSEENYEEKFKLLEDSKYFDILINDKNSYIRQAIAKQGYGLNILVYDKAYFVREEVAKEGYGLDVLVDDEYIGVRRIVKHFLEINNLTLEEWKLKYPERCILNE